MKTILVMPENERQLKLLKAMFEEMQIKYRSEKTGEDLFYPELENKIKEARKEKEKGELLTIDSEKLWESI
ncbi:MAG TPA: hypothetical protein DDZ96_00360 [Porphyromonadaceae bacterium]|jgi:hypothetical protein|uniref:DUF2683 family protein n=1 Tax=Limibacterium fermenti TaxID=3229863 RepID=UPI000E9F2CAC|nr:hypothetical protein [Porphyromonadaceae bacterium]